MKKLVVLLLCLTFLFAASDIVDKKEERELLRRRLHDEYDGDGKGRGGDGYVEDGYRPGDGRNRRHSCRRVVRRMRRCLERCHDRCAAYMGAGSFPV